MAYQTDDLLADIKRDSYFPTVQGNFTDAQLLTIGDQEYYESLAPMFKSLGSGLGVETVDTTIVASMASYTLPQYAMWQDILRADLKYTSGNIRTLSLIQEGELANWSLAGTADPWAYYLEGDQIVLVPTPSSSAATNWTLRQRIYRRPGRMVRATTSGTNTAGAAQILSINTGTGVVTYTAAPPSSFTSSSSHDFYSATPPFKRLGTACVATAASGSTQTFSVANAALPSANDWVVLNDTTVYPPVPIEIMPFLKELIIKSVAKTQADQAAYALAKAEIVDRARAAMIGPGGRAKDQPKKIPIAMGLIARKRRIVWSD